MSLLPGTNVTIGQPISHRIDHMLSGTRANIAVKIFGDDLPTLRQLAGAGAGRDGRRCPASSTSSTEQQTDIPTLKVRVDRGGSRPPRARHRRRRRGAADGARRARGRPDPRGADRVSAGRALRRLDDSTDLDAIGTTPIQTPDRRADSARRRSRRSSEDRGPNFVMRENVQRRIVVQSNVAGPRPAQRRQRHPGARRAERAHCRRAITSSTAGSSRARPRRRGSCSGCRLGVIVAIFFILIGGVRLVAGRSADHAQPAAGADRRRGRRLPGGRRALGRVDRRLHHAVRHRDAQRHHARLAHPPPAGARRRRRTSARPSSAARPSGSCRS